MSHSTSYTEHAHAHVTEEEHTKLDKVKDALRGLVQSPSSGRTTKLGRKVEKPGSGRQGGPSGQTDSSKHDGTHTNR